MDIDADEGDNGPIFPHKRQQLDVDVSLNHKIMVGSIFSLSLVILLVLIFKIYARFMTRNRPILLAREHPADHPKSGLEPTLLASLPTFLIKDQRTDTNTTECSVCLSALELGNVARLLPNCNHIFHVDCVDKWLINQSNCPMCRAEVCPS